MPAWFAAITTVPDPVIVRVLPLIVPGPETMLKTTGLPEAPPVATRVMGDTPLFTGEAGAVKLMVCEALLIVRVVRALPAKLLLSPE